RRQEVESRSRVFTRQSLPQALHIICRGAVLFSEGHQNVGVARSDEARCAVHKIDGAVGQSDVIQNVVDIVLGNLAPYRALDEVAQLRCLLDPRATLGAQMEDELTVVGVRKKILTEPRHKEECRRTGQQKRRDEQGSAPHNRREKAVVGIPKALEFTLERLLEAYQRIP